MFVPAVSSPLPLLLVCLTESRIQWIYDTAVPIVVRGLPRCAVPPRCWEFARRLDSRAFQPPCRCSHSLSLWLLHVFSLSLIVELRSCRAWISLRTKEAIQIKCSPFLRSLESPLSGPRFSSLCPRWRLRAVTINLTRQFLRLIVNLSRTRAQCNLKTNVYFCRIF